MPELSILIVAYHSHSDLAICLPSLEAQTYRDAQILVVNNSPEDNLTDWLKREYPNVRVIENPNNTGYAGGNNLGLAHLHSDFVLLLNPDTVLAPDALETLMCSARQHPNAMLNPMLLSPDGTVNTCGLEMHLTGITTCRGLGQHPAKFQTLHDIPLLSGAALLAPTHLLKSLGGFDETYFMYMEDVALSLRAKLFGIPLLCEPRAKITHAYKAAFSTTKFFYLERNRWLTLLTMCEVSTLKRLALALLFTELMTWGYALLQGPAYLKTHARVYKDLWLQRKPIREKRKRLQQQRRFADDVWLNGCLTTLPFAQLVSSPRLADILQRISQWLYFKPRNLEKAS